MSENENKCLNLLSWYDVAISDCIKERAQNLQTAEAKRESDLHDERPELWGVSEAGNWNLLHEGGQNFENNVVRECVTPNWPITFPGKIFLDV